MESMFRKTLFLAIFLCSLFTQGKLPENALLGISAQMPSLLVSPQLGYAAMVSGWLSNIRFYGLDTHGEKKERREYAADEGSDPTWQLVKFLFPSVTGSLSAVTNYDSSFGKYFPLLSPEQQGRVIAILVAYADAIRNGSDLPQTAELTDSSHSPYLFGGPNFSKLRTKKIAEKFLKLIQESVRKEKEGLTPYPIGTTEQVVLAFFYDQGEGKKALQSFVHNSDEILKRKLDPLMPRQAKTMDKLFYNLLLQNPQSQWMAYNTSDILIEYGSNTLAYNQRTKVQSQEVFSDCSETTIRHFLNLILYHPDAKKFEIPNNPGYPPSYKNLVAFYEKQTPTLANSNDPAVHSLWNTVVGDLTEGASPMGLVYYQEGDSQNTGQYNLAPGFINMLRVLYLVFNLPVPQSPLPNLQGDCSPDMIKAGSEYLQEAFQKIIEVLHPGLQVQIEIQALHCAPYYFPRESEKDFFGQMKFTVLDANQKPLISFDISQQPLHSKACSLKDHQSIQAEEPQPVTKEEILDLSPFETQRSLVPTKNLAQKEFFDQKSVFYYLFSMALMNAPQAQIELLERIDCALTPPSSLRVDFPFTLLLKNLLRSFDYRDAHSSLALSSCILKVLAYHNAALNEVFYGNLLSFDLDKIQADSINFSQFRALKRIKVDGSQNLKSVIFGPANEALESITFFSSSRERSSIESLDLRPLKALKTLELADLRSLKSVMFGPENQALESIIFHKSSIESLDLRPLKALKTLDLFAASGLKSVMFGPENEALEKIKINHRSLMESLDLSSLKALKTLNFWNLSELQSLTFGPLNIALKAVVLQELPKLKNITGIENILYILGEIRCTGIPSLDDFLNKIKAEVASHLMKRVENMG